MSGGIDQRRWIEYPASVKRVLKIYEFPVVVEKDEKGYFFVYAPSLQGCYTQGRSLEEALKNIREVIQLHVEDRRALKEAVPYRKPVSFSSVEVRV
ncbi:type II toxin-antitoxin system HicB family antitoxin [Candidatus Kaiserbacteria bacterium]|nr:type II toxin-antitoxin system HicB family antitoxin [Candidatus Kaiserbacteria bacterium]